MIKNIKTCAVIKISTTHNDFGYSTIELSFLGGAGMGNQMLLNWKPDIPC